MPVIRTTMSVGAAFGALAIGCAASAGAQQRVAVADARPLLLAAIDAPDGRASGVLTGPLADAVSERFQATSPIHVDVTTVSRLAQPGCSRLKVTFRQDGVRLPGTSAPRRQQIEFGIDYCRDGLPPRPAP